MSAFAYTENGKAVSGMGAEFRDLDNDGFQTFGTPLPNWKPFPVP